METNTAGHTPNSTLTYGDISREPGSLPAASVSALLARGFAHYLGNEQASKVVAQIRQAIVAGTERKADTVSREEVATFRAEQADLVSAMVESVMSAALAALDEGKVGVRVSNGPSVTRDPVQAEARRIARSEVTAILKNNGIAVPKGDATVTMGEAAYTMEDLIARRLEREGERIKAEAAKTVKAAQRKKDQLLANGGAVADLGL